MTATTTSSYTGRSPDPSFEYPPQYWFPPFFTIQPNSTTRLAQFRAWSDLIQRYCRHHRIFKISAVDAAATTAGGGFGGDGRPGGGGERGGASTGWPLFHNRDLSRRLDVRGISEVLGWMSGRNNEDGDTGGGGGGSGGKDDKEKGKRGKEIEGRAERLQGEKETGESVGGTYWIFWRTPEEWAGVLMDWIERTGQKGSVLTLYEIAEGEGSLSEGSYYPHVYFT